MMGNNGVMDGGVFSAALVSYWYFLLAEGLQGYATTQLSLPASRRFREVLIIDKEIESSIEIKNENVHQASLENRFLGNYRQAVVSCPI